MAWNRTPTAVNDGGRNFLGADPIRKWADYFEDQQDQQEFNSNPFYAEEPAPIIEEEQEIESPIAAPKVEATPMAPVVPETEPVPAPEQEKPEPEPQPVVVSTPAPIDQGFLRNADRQAPKAKDTEFYSGDDDDDGLKIPPGYNGYRGSTEELEAQWFNNTPQVVPTQEPTPQATPMPSELLVPTPGVNGYAPQYVPEIPQINPNILQPPQELPGLPEGAYTPPSNPLELGVRNVLNNPTVNGMDNPLTNVSDQLAQQRQEYADVAQRLVGTNPFNSANRQGGELLFPTDYGSSTIPDMPESPNPLAPILEPVGNAAHEIVSDYDTAITDTDDAILDAVAGLYNANESDGWLMEQVSDLYGTLPPIDPDAPMADVLEQQRRERLLALLRQIQADDELVDDRPDITGQGIKDALNESQEEARVITNELINGAREITEPIQNDLFDWMSSGSNYGGNVSEAADAALAAGLVPGTIAYDRFITNYLGSIDGGPSAEAEKDTSEEPRTYGYTDNILNSYANATGRALEDMDESDYRTMRDLNREAAAVAEQARFNALANGDVRNIPPQDLVGMLGRMTDPAYAQSLEQQYQQLKDLGMNDRQISAELYRRAAEHMNPLARATDAQGGLNYDFALAGSGILPDDVAIPTVDEYGNGNAAFNEFANSVDYFDDKGNTIYQNADGTFTEAVPQADGTVDYRKYNGEVISTYRYTPDQVLSMYVNPNGGQNGEPTWRGLDGVFEGLTPEERAGMEELLANFVGGGDLNRIRDGFNREFTTLTDEQFERLAQLFLNKMPAIQDLIDRGVLSERDVANFFFKAPKSAGSKSGGSGSGGKGGYGGRYYGGGGGYGYNYGGRSRTSQYSPSAANQRQNRVYNIMKNWSF